MVKVQIGQSYEARHKRDGGRRIRIIGAIAPDDPNDPDADERYLAVDLETGRQSKFLRRTLEIEWQRVEDNRKPPSKPVPRRRAPGSNKGRRPIALDLVVQIMRANGAPMTQDAILSTLRHEHGLIVKSKWTVWRYLQKLEKAGVVQVFVPTTKDPYLYKLVTGEAEGDGEKDAA